MMRVYDVLHATGGYLLKGDSDRKIRHISIDSRTIKPGSLFFAVKGANFDGHRFISKAVSKGAQAVVVSKKITSVKGVAVIHVQDTIKALGDLASWYRQQFDVRIIAITGSCGKTTTKELIAHVLKGRYHVLKNERSENNHIGVPLTLFKLRRHHDIAVLEVGTNRVGDIEYLAKIVKPDVAVFTNIGPSHLEGLKSIQGVYKEKLNLLRYLKPSGGVVYNKDDKYLRKIGWLKEPKEKVGYSVSASSDVKASRIYPYKIKGISFSVGGKTYYINSLAKHSIYNALVAISCSKLFSLSYNNICGGLKSFKACDGRFKVVKAKGVYFIDDSYNANPISYQSAVDSLEEMSCAGKKILVCGDMLELGDHAKKLHQQLGRHIASTHIEWILAYGQMSEFIVSKIPRKRNTKHFNDIGKLTAFLESILKPGDLVLVKGSRGMKMERVLTLTRRS